MFVKSCVGIGDELFIESPLIRSTLVTAHQQNGCALGIKRKCHPPYAAIMIETQLLHICVLRAFERIHRWPAQVGAEFLKESGVGEQFILECTIQRQKLGVKVIVKKYVPGHGQIMYLKTYLFKVSGRLQRLFNEVQVNLGGAKGKTRDATFPRLSVGLRAQRNLLELYMCK